MPILDIQALWGGFDNDGYCGDHHDHYRVVFLMCTGLVRFWISAFASWAFGIGVATPLSSWGLYRMTEWTCTASEARIYSSRSRAVARLFWSWIARTSLEPIGSVQGVLSIFYFHIYHCTLPLSKSTRTACPAKEGSRCTDLLVLSADGQCETTSLLAQEQLLLRTRQTMREKTGDQHCSIDETKCILEKRPDRCRFCIPSAPASPGPAFQFLEKSNVCNN